MLLQNIFATIHDYEKAATKYSFTALHNMESLLDSNCPPELSKEYLTLMQYKLLGAFTLARPSKC